MVFISLLQCRLLTNSLQFAMKLLIPLLIQNFRLMLFYLELAEQATVE
jgi:hypothetical protein